MSNARTLPVSSASAADESHSLRAGRLGVIGIVFFVIAAAAPLAGMTGALPAAIVLGNGAAAPGAYLLAGLTLLLFSVGYAAMSHQVTNSGAFFAYIGRGLGLHMGVASAFTSLLAYLAIHLSLFGFFGGLMAEQVGVMPWWAWAFVAWAAVTWLSLRSVDCTSRRDDWNAGANPNSTPVRSATASVTTLWRIRTSDPMALHVMT